MALVGLLFAHHGAAGSPEPMASLDVAGLSSVERQVHYVRDAGATRIFVVAERMPPALAAALARLADDVRIVRDAAALAAALRDEDRLLVIEEGLVAEGRVAGLMIESGQAPLLAVWQGSSRLAHAERLDSASFWAGLAIYDGRTVRAVAADLGDWDLQSTLLRTAVGIGAARFDVAAADPEAAGRWLHVRSDADAGAASRSLVERTGGEPRDAVERYVHRPLEDWAVPLLLSRHVTSRQLLAATLVAGGGAVAAFATGWTWTGLILGLLSAPLSGATTRLARIRIEDLPYPDLRWRYEAGIEYAWHLALALHFVRSGTGGAWAVAALIVLFAFAADLQRSFFRSLHGGSLDEAEPDARRRWPLASRNTRMWALLPFALFGAWYAGFTAVAVYSAASFFVVQRRLFGRIPR
jgi:hypothetical protein